MFNTTNRNSRRGFTLVELIIVIVILMILLIVFCAGPIAYFIVSEDIPDARDAVIEAGISEYDVVRAEDPPFTCDDKVNSIRIKYQSVDGPRLADVCYSGTEFTVTDLEE